MVAITARTILGELVGIDANPLGVLLNPAGGDSDMNLRVAAGVDEARSERMLSHGGGAGSVGIGGRVGETASLKQADRRRAVLVLLASRSPRRRELLTEHGIDFHVVESGIDDTHLEPGRVEPAQWSMALAHLKAAGAARGVEVRRELVAHPDRKLIVLGADTIVVKDGRVLPAPTTPGVAREILRSLRNGQHSVISGVCLLDLRADERRMLADEASVRVGDISDVEIERYVESGAWAGKAGAYNIGERRAAGWPITHEGAESTIVGLPMARLLQALDSFA